VQQQQQPRGWAFGGGCMPPHATAAAAAARPAPPHPPPHSPGPCPAAHRKYHENIFRLNGAYDRELRYSAISRNLLMGSIHHTAPKDMADHISRMITTNKKVRGARGASGSGRGRGGAARPAAGTRLDARRPAARGSRQLARRPPAAPVPRRQPVARVCGRPSPEPHPCLHGPGCAPPRGRSPSRVPPLPPPPLRRCTMPSTLPASAAWPGRCSPPCSRRWRGGHSSPGQGGRGVCAGRAPVCRPKGERGGLGLGAAAAAARQPCNPPLLPGLVRGAWVTRQPLARWQWARQPGLAPGSLASRPAAWPRARQPGVPPGHCPPGAPISWAAPWSPQGRLPAFVVVTSAFCNPNRSLARRAQLPRRRFSPLGRAAGTSRHRAQLHRTL